MTLSPLTAAGILAVLVGAALAHELTHVVVAKAFGARLHTSWRDLLGLDIYYEVPADYPLWVDRVINLAPLVAGGGIGVGYLILSGRPPETLWGFIGLVCWGIYTIGGGPADYSLDIAHGKGWWWARRSDHERGAVLAVALVATGYGFLWGTGWIDINWQMAVAVQQIGVVFTLAGIGAFGLSVRDAAHTSLE